mgnify:CR=1 FL=1
MNIPHEIKEYREYPAWIKRVIDGDTVEALIDMGFGIKYKTKLRFYDFNAPETWRPSCKEERELGLKAKKYLIDNIEKKTVLLRTHKTGKYGRVLAEVFLGDRDIIQELKDLNLTKEWFEKVVLRE